MSNDGKPVPADGERLLSTKSLHPRGASGSNPTPQSGHREDEIKDVVLDAWSVRGAWRASKAKSVRKRSREVKSRLGMPTPSLEGIPVDPYRWVTNTLWQISSFWMPD